MGNWNTIPQMTLNLEGLLGGLGVAKGLIAAKTALPLPPSAALENPFASVLEETETPLRLLQGKVHSIALHPYTQGVGQGVGNKSLPVEQLFQAFQESMLEEADPHRPNYAPEENLGLLAFVFAARSLEQLLALVEPLEKLFTLQSFRQLRLKAEAFKRLQQEERTFPKAPVPPNWQSQNLERNLQSFPLFSSLKNQLSTLKGYAEAAISAKEKLSSALEDQTQRLENLEEEISNLTSSLAGWGGQKGGFSLYVEGAGTRGCLLEFSKAGNKPPKNLPFSALWALAGPKEAISALASFLRMS